ncbi:nuclear transport factor 2 family protein [Paraburkholderia flava]|uniref:nuclear transport factor 2 family protein n=1 Tax=Paraburkholderia flava TaxID=2547393 RepID=UPI00105B94E2|nr:nuclear transport factor 2 family protein [Paraburkholderia flava]
MTQTQTPTQTQTQAVAALIDDYFNLAYEPKSRDFGKVFHPVCVVQWLDEGRLNTLSSPDYAALINDRPSPRSTDSPRDEAILSIENISDSLSTATARVRIGKKLFNDHLVMHKVDGNWLITVKASFIARTFD